MHTKNNMKYISSNPYTYGYKSSVYTNRICTFLCLHRKFEDGSQFPIVTSELTSLSLLWVNSPKKGIVCLPI